MALILVGSWVASGADLVEVVGTLAVFVMTRRVSVADRMSETVASLPEAKLLSEKTPAACHVWFYRYLYLGEALWATYFVMKGAWAALVGVGLMLAYPAWRKYYRLHYPIDRNNS